MTPDERQLINGLFDRMRGFGAVEKDRDAEALISQTVRQMPDAPYMLVQSVLVQEHALQQAEQRMRELEDKVHDLEAQAASGPPQQPGGGSFLGGLFGGGGGSRPAPQDAPIARSSVPATGGRPYANPDYQSGAPMGAPGPAGSPWGQSGPQGPGAGPGGGGPGGGGGFMRSAMSTAAGVAGGMLLANSISSMLGGHSAAAASPAPHAPEAAVAHEAQPEPHYQDADDNDPGSEPEVEDADFDDDNDPGDDMGGDDLDI